MKRLIAEFEEQNFTQIIFPHKDTDWSAYLEEAEETFIHIINTISKFQKCFVICADITYVKSKFPDHHNLYFAEYLSNDTWARDCSCLCVEEDSDISLLDFTFNAWGNKFDSQKDNAMSQAMKNIYLKDLHTQDFVLEGGAVESNGVDTILTTTACMLNRNSHLNSIEVTQKLNTFFGATKILYLDHGYLAGDDTDSHIDTLARFINEDTIMYVKCEDEKDEHFDELALMEAELEEIAKQNSFKLIALPLPEAIYFAKERLPATYANFLFVNGAVLVPVYGAKEDSIALDIFTKNFPTKKIIPINCSTLIKQHGSLHCVTMNFARGVTLLI
ncbi:MAG: agmatine deiminase family protein [Sulfurimonas sp.]|nr:agmatine deiminase family protein [Sulfurimonas sp.]